MCIFVTLITMFRRDIISRDKKKLCGHRNLATKLQLAETVLFFCHICFGFFSIYRAGTFKQQGINFQCIITCRHTACIYNYILNESTNIFVTVPIQLSIFNSVKKQILVYIHRKIGWKNEYNMFKHIVSETNGCDKY